MGAIDCVGQQAGRTILDVLRTMAWADGRLADVELRAVRGASLALGLVEPLGEPLEHGTPPLHELGLENLQPSERHILYACAAWMTLIDDIQTPRESLALARLRRYLSLTPEAASSLEDLSYAVRSRWESRAALWRELDVLITTVARHARRSTTDDQGRGAAA